ncbi:NAD binding domain of 6-phosphogluconate dehydrogenase-domain-containing protein [Cercophora newfieldiana]|uniref:NAD binding domain of 6-phosphogluconate dehydrogenase-domain-containing protein n=1 Tax=Cercophora newfieldiana TaxID=92897 RepID=A0AA39XWP2_9PEZI|nr:NAD binding domain of 6-phosphogluconate dehydrogenase-domain-containing protein [Cercophora newfieldiana]
MAPKLFWIGLGNMGRGMVKNLVEKGNLDQPILLFNRTKQRAVDLSNQLAAGTTEVVESIGDGVSKADVIFVILSQDDVVEAAVNEILQNDVAGKLIIECSTIHPDTTEKLAKLVEGKGAEYLTAPVFGAPAAADAGQLVGVLAGPSSAIDRAKPYFEGVMSRRDIEMRDEPRRKALTLKLIGNTFILNMVEQLAEGHVLAEKSGLGNNYLHQWIEGMFPGPYAAYSNRMLSGDYYQRDYPLFAVDLARKDARHAMSLAKAAGAPVPNTELADSHLVKVKEHAGELGDFAGIYGVVRKEAGLPYENK